ncbi:MAG: LAGLIDADG family homing endonuclease [Rhabdochlamydiaceae bacterium]
MNDPENKYNLPPMGEKKQKLVEALIDYAKLANQLLYQKGQESLFLFNKYILEVEKGKEQLADFHDELCQFVQNNKHKKKLILIPRGHLKSTLITIGYSTQQICYNPNIRILILNAVWQLAVDFLTEIKRNLQTNEKILELYGDLTAGNSEWAQDRITLARTDHNIKGPTVWAAGVDSNLTGSHPDMIIMDDVVSRDNTQTIEQIEKVKLRYRDALDLLEPGGQLLIIGCLTGDSRVLMANGLWRNINKVKVGEMVFSYKDKKMVKRKVEAMIPQGKAKTYRILTNRHELKATDRHPFLVIENGETVWKPVKELQIGDKVVTIQQAHVETSKHFYNGKFMRKDDFWFLGYLWGDGWLINTKDKGIVGFCVAKGVHDKYLSILKKWAPNFKDTGFGYYRIQNTEIGRWLKKHGFTSGAKIKRLPEWIYQTRTSYKKDFIRGLLDADGSKLSNGKGYRIELANKELIEDIYYLALTCGYQPTKIYHRRRFIQAPHSKSETWHDFYSIGLNPNLRQSFGENQYSWRWERIEEIIEAEEEEVFDLTIEETANFIAEGYVVHNTRWTYADFYSWILDREEGIMQDYDIMIKRAYTGDLETGVDLTTLWPAKFTQKELKNRLQQKGSYEFNAQYNNDPVAEENADFKRTWFQYYNPEDYRGNTWQTVMTVDPAISLKKEADFTAIGVISIDKFTNLFVRDLARGHWKPNEINTMIFYLYELYHPSIIGIETVAYQKALAYGLNDEMRRRNKYLPIVEKAYQERSKVERIRALQPLYENGKIFHYKQLKFNQYLEEELLKFPRGRRDDLADVLSMALDYLVPPAKKEKRYHRGYLY